MVTSDSGDRWELSDGVVVIRPPSSGDLKSLVDGRDGDMTRWLGASEELPNPAACVLVGTTLVGWVDYDTDQAWLGPNEVNIGYAVFAPYRRRGYARRAVGLLLRHIADATDTARAYLAIDTENLASLGVARALGGVEVDRYPNDEQRIQIRFVIPITSRTFSRVRDE